MSRRRNQFKILEIPSSRGDVHIELADGSICVRDEAEETFCDGWATVKDIAETLVERVHLPPQEAQSLAVRAVREWEAWLGDRPHRYPRR
jgi:hypothetical protein